MSIFCLKNSDLSISALAFSRNGWYTKDEVLGVASLPFSDLVTAEDSSCGKVKIMKESGYWI